MKTLFSFLFSIFMFLGHQEVFCQLTTQRAKVTIDSKDSSSTVSLDSAKVIFMQKILEPEYNKMTNFTDLFQFKNPNVIQQKTPFTVNLGNSNSAYYSLAHNVAEKIDLTGFNNAYPHYSYQWKDIQWLQTSTPYTELFYSSASRLDQQLHARFFRSLSNQVKMGFDIRRLTSRGLFVELNTINQAERQKAVATNMYLNFQFSSKQKKHQLYLASLYNTWRANEYGGILSDSLYENADLQQKPNTFGKMKGQNFSKNYGVELTYTYEPNKISSSLLPDSTTKNVIFSPYKFYVKTSYLQTFKRYSDEENDSSFYKNFYKNMTSTYDSLNSYIYKQEAGFMLQAPKYFLNNQLYTRAFTSRLGFENSFYLNFDSLGKQTFQTQKLLVYIENTNKSKFSFKSHGYYHLAGYHKNSFHAQASFDLKITEDISLQSKAQYQDYNLIPYALIFKTNHHSWKTKNSIRTKDLSIQAGLKYKNNINIWLSNFSHEGFLYYDTTGNLRQFNDQLNVQQIQFSARKNIGEWEIQNTSIYQIINQTNILQLPNFMSSLSIFYKNKLFAKKLRYHLGADFTYNTPFFARDYAPDLQQFHLQNQTKYSFPILFQPFFSCNLKRFDFMVKINNALDGLFTKRAIYYSPSYPQAPRAVQIALSWKFYD